MDNNPNNPNEQMPQAPQGPQAFQPQPVMQQPPVMPTPAVAPPQPVFNSQQAMMPPQPKKSLLWLWISLAVVVVIIIGLVVGFFVAKSGADKAAADYTSNAKTYLADVYDAASGSATDPTDLEADVKKIDKPELKSAFLSSVSSKYADAKKLADDVDEAVSTLDGKLKSYAEYYDFYNANKKINEESRDIIAGFTQANASSTLKKFGGKLDELTKLVHDTTFPDELAGKKSSLETAFKTCATAWHAMESAFDARSQSQYSAAYGNYSDCLAPLTAASKPFNDYYNDLASKIKDAAKEVQDLQDEVDTKEA